MDDWIEWLGNDPVPRDPAWVAELAADLTGTRDDWLRGLLGARVIVHPYCPRNTCYVLPPLGEPLENHEVRSILADTYRTITNMFPAIEIDYDLDKSIHPHVKSVGV